MAERLASHPEQSRGFGSTDWGTSSLKDSAKLTTKEGKQNLEVLFMVGGSEEYMKLGSEEDDGKDETVRAEAQSTSQPTKD